jgi:hypothetical protein
VSSAKALAARLNARNITEERTITVFIIGSHEEKSGGKPPFLTLRLSRSSFLRSGILITDYKLKLQLPLRSGRVACPRCLSELIFNYPTVSLP